MNICPFCKERFEYKDLLFFATREITGGGRKGARGSSAGMGGGMSGMGGMGGLGDLGGFGGRRNSGRNATVAEIKKEEVAAEAEAPVENKDSFIGKWTRDEKYEEFRSVFWKAEGTKAEERFIVRWGDKAEPGCAEPQFWSDDHQYPTVVSLCGKDAADVGETLMNMVMCPHCHCSIPTSYLKIEDKNCHSVALIGFPSSGKTAYKLAIMNELIKKLKRNFMLCQEVEICADTKKFATEEAEAFVDGGAESTIKEAIVFPMIFAVVQKDASYLLTVYDLPGEAYTDEHSIKLAKHKGIQNVDAAILLVDACQLYENSRVDTVQVEKKNSAGEVVIEEAAVGYANPDTEITQPLKYMKAYQIGSKIQNLALVVTKTDLLIGKFGRAFGESDNTALKMLKMLQSDEAADHKKSVSMPVIRKVDNETMTAIMESPNYEDKDNIKQEICDMFAGNTLRPENISAFAISTLRRPDPNVVHFVVSDESQYPRHRVLEPMLYFMAKWGMVPSAQVMAAPVNNEPEIKEEKKGLFKKLFGR